LFELYSTLCVRPVRRHPMITRPIILCNGGDLVKKEMCLNGGQGCGIVPVTRYLWNPASAVL
jgi:hypothetical protein